MLLGDVGVINGVLVGRRERSRFQDCRRIVGCGTVCAVASAMSAMIDRCRAIANICHLDGAWLRRIDNLIVEVERISELGCVCCCLTGVGRKRGIRSAGHRARFRLSGGGDVI